MSLSNVRISKSISLFEESDSKDLLQKAESLAVSGFIDNTVLKEEILQLTGNRGDYMSGNWSAIIDKIKHLFRKQKIEVLGSQMQWLPISVYHCYCPEVEHAKVKIEYKTTDSSEGETSVEVLGIGGGASFNIEFSSSLEVESENKSFALVYEFESEWEHIRLTEPNGNVVEFCKLTNINSNNRKVNTSSLMPVLFNINEADMTEIITLKEGTTGTKKLVVKSGSELKVSNKLKLEQFGLEAGTEITTANQFEVAYEYTLPGGKIYTAMHPKNAAYWLWEAK
jgi:uncharacterized protein YrzB (UPF0473 family)